MAGVIVVGAGQAAASCAARLRAGGYDGPVALIGAETVLPYQRPPLSKAYLKGDMAFDRLLLRPAQWYADQRIEVVTGQTVTAIDPQAMTVTAGGATRACDDIVLATGAVPRALPAAVGGDLAGVFLVRSLADVDALGPEMRAGRRLLVVGGGYIGLEAAAVAAGLGLEVTLVEAAARILQRVAAPETSDAIRALHAAHGVTIREGTGLDALTGDGRVTGARLADGTEIAVDLAIVGIGVTPATALAEQAGLALDNGIAVDARGQTSAPRVWAAGDCASLPWRGARIRLESVQNAIEQAEAVADSILAAAGQGAGAARAYDPVPWFWSDQYDMKLQIAGLNTGYDRVVVRPGPSHWYFRGATLLAVDALGDARAYMVGKRLLEAGRSPDPAALADPDTDLKALLRA